MAILLEFVVFTNTIYNMQTYRTIQQARHGYPRGFWLPGGSWKDCGVDNKYTNLAEKSKELKVRDKTFK